MNFTDDELKEILRSIGISEDDLEKYVVFLKNAIKDYLAMSNFDFDRFSRGELVDIIKRSIYEKLGLDIVNELYYNQNAKKYEDEVLKLNNCFVSFWFVKNVKDADIRRHQDIIIKSKNLYYIYCFAKEVKGANIEELKDTIVKSNNVEYAYKFARDIKHIDIKELADIVIESKDPEYNYKFAKDIIGASVEAHRKVVIESGDPVCNYLFAKDISGDIEDTELSSIEAHRKVVIDSKSPEYNYKFAKDIIGSSIEVHSRVIIESGSGIYNYLFARDIKGADIKKHIDVLLDSESSEDVKYIYQFTRDIDEWLKKYNDSYLNLILKCEDAIIRCQNPEYIYKFAKDIDRGNLLRLMDALLGCHGPNISKYIYKFIIDLRRDSLMNKKISDDDIGRCIEKIIDGEDSKYNHLVANDVDTSYIYQRVLERSKKNNKV